MPDAQALATILAVYAQRHGGPSQLAADRLVALLTAPTDSAPGTLPRFFFDWTLFMIFQSGSDMPIVVSPAPTEDPFFGEN